MTDKAPEIITLKALCAELKIDPKEARERLRDAVRDPKKYPELAKSHKPRSPWQWVKGSTGEEEAKRLAIFSVCWGASKKSKDHLSDTLSYGFYSSGLCHLIHVLRAAANVRLTIFVMCYVVFHVELCQFRFLLKECRVCRLNRRRQFVSTKISRGTPVKSSTRLASACRPQLIPFSRRLFARAPCHFKSKLSVQNQI
jgi:hypothetical protein